MDTTDQLSSIKPGDRNSIGLALGLFLLLIFYQVYFINKFLLPMQNLVSIDKNGELLECKNNIKKIKITFCLLNSNLQITIKAINDKKIDPKKIASMRQSELNLLLSSKQYVDIIKKRELNMMLSEKKGSSAFECKKCKKSKCSIIEKQVRSADEPATQFITCLECGHVFTI